MTRYLGLKRWHWAVVAIVAVAAIGNVPAADQSIARAFGSVVGALLFVYLAVSLLDPPGSKNREETS